jgi:hypothetical protein
MRILSNEAQSAVRRVQSYSALSDDPSQFLEDVTEMILAVQEDAAAQYYELRTQAVDYQVTRSQGKKIETFTMPDGKEVVTVSHDPLGRPEPYTG